MSAYWTLVQYQLPSHDQGSAGIIGLMALLGRALLAREKPEKRLWAVLSNPRERDFAAYVGFKPAGASASWAIQSERSLCDNDILSWLFDNGYRHVNGTDVKDDNFSRNLSLINPIVQRLHHLDNGISGF